jgi:hypothetical protein
MVVLVSSQAMVLKPERLALLVNEKILETWRMWAKAVSLL